MNRITKLAGTAVITGVAGIALAGPAISMQLPEPISNGPLVQHTAARPATPVDDTTPWREVGLGALGGIAVAAAGMAAATSVRHHRHPIPLA